MGDQAVIKQFHLFRLNTVHFNKEKKMCILGNVEICNDEICFV